MVGQKKAAKVGSYKRLHPLIAMSNQGLHLLMNLYY